MVKSAVKREWSALGRPTNRDEWDMTADTVNVSCFGMRACVVLLSSLIADTY